MSSAHSLTFAVSVAASLTLSVACSDAAAPHAGQQPVSGQSPQAPATATLGFEAREILVGTTVNLSGPLVYLVSNVEASGGISWTSDNPEVASVSARSLRTARVNGLKPGRARITASAGGAVARIELTVLAETTEPSPIVVDDFYVMELSEEPHWGYVPQFVLRDLSGEGRSAVIGVSFELPAAGGPSPGCAMLRHVGAQPMELFHERYGDYELSLYGADSYRAPAGDSVVAHLMLRVPGPYAKQLTLIGRIVPGAYATTYSRGWVGDVLSCG